MNAREIAAAQAAAAEQARMKAAAEATRAKLEPRVSGATQLSSAIDKFSNVYKKIGLKAPEKITPKLASEVAKYGERKAELASTIIDPYQQALGVLGQAPVAIPAAVYQTVVDEGPLLAKETFRKTLALFFGAEEAAKPWVDELYKVVSGYYKTGSTIDEALNLSLRDARNNPNLTKFTNRFRAIFSLEDKLRAGQAVYVPTIAEYVQTEAKVGDIFRLADLPTLANQDTIADVLSLGKSVSEITGLVNNVFNVIDNAPEIWKKELSNKFPTATRSGLATAILLGEKSARELEKTTQISGVQAAAKAQGLSVSEQRAGDIFAQGYGFAQAMPKFGEVAQILPRAQQLAAISRREPLTQLDVEQARIENIASQQMKLQEIAQEEINRMSGRSGRLETGLASQRRANRAF